MDTQRPDLSVIPSSRTAGGPLPQDTHPMRQTGAESGGRQNLFLIFTNLFYTLEPSFPHFKYLRLLSSVLLDSDSLSKVSNFVLFPVLLFLFVCKECSKTHS